MHILGKTFTFILRSVSMYLGFPSGAVVKNLSANVEAAGGAGWEDPLEEEMATHSSILAWRIPWAEKPGWLWSMGLQSQTRLSMHACTTWVL